RAIDAMPKHLMSYGSGALNFVLQLGGAFGTVTLVVMIDRRTAIHSAMLTNHGLTPGNPMALQALNFYGELAAHVGVAPVNRQSAASYLLSKVDATWA